MAADAPPPYPRPAAAPQAGSLRIEPPSAADADAAWSRGEMPEPARFWVSACAPSRRLRLLAAQPEEPGAAFFPPLRAALHGDAAADSGASLVLAYDFDAATGGAAAVDGPHFPLAPAGLRRKRVPRRGPGEAVNRTMEWLAPSRVAAVEAELASKA